MSEVMYQEIDRGGLKQAYFKKLIGEMIGNNIGQDPKMVGNLCEALNITYESQLPVVENGNGKIMNSFMKAVMETVDRTVDDYIADKKGIIRTPYTGDLALEAALEEMVQSDSEDASLGSTLADMILDVANRTSNEIKDMAKYVLRLEKETQASKKEELLNENEDIVEEDKDAAGNDPFGENSEGGSDDQNQGDDDNPFGTGGDDFGGDTGSTGFGDTGDAGSDNPFGEGDTGTEEGDSGESNPFEGGESESGKGEENKESSNPFDDDGLGEGNEGEGGDTTSEDQTNPFDEPSGENNNQEGQAEVKNPFESVNNISMLQLKNGRRPFFGLENGNLTNFILTATKPIFEEKMRAAFESSGPNGDEFLKLSKDFKKSSKIGLEALVGVIGYCSLLGLEYDRSIVRDPELLLFK